MQAENYEEKSEQGAEGEVRYMHALSHSYTLFYTVFGRIRYTDSHLAILAHLRSDTDVIVLVAPGASTRTLKRKIGRAHV